MYAGVFAGIPVVISDGHPTKEMKVMFCIPT